MGIGLGGFVDGILLHQILQWHGMVSHYYPKTSLSPDVVVRNLQINMFWDGLLHNAKKTLIDDHLDPCLDESVRGQGLLLERCSKSYKTTPSTYDDLRRPRLFRVNQSRIHVSR